MKIRNIFLDAFVTVVHLFSDFLKLGPRNWTKTTYMRVQCSLGHNNFKVDRTVTRLVDPVSSLLKNDHETIQ